MRPEQVRRIDENTEIILIKGLPPLRMSKVKYYSDRILRRILHGTGRLPEPKPITQEIAASATPLQWEHKGEEIEGTSNGEYFADNEVDTFSPDPIALGDGEKYLDLADQDQCRADIKPELQLR